MRRIWHKLFKSNSSFYEVNYQQLSKLPVVTNADINQKLNKDITKTLSDLFFH